MTKEDKAKYNIEGIASVFRNVMFGMALIILVGYGASYISEKPEIENYFFYSALVIGIPFLIFKSNSNQHKISKKQ